MQELAYKSVATQLKMPWRRSIAVGRAYELLRADTLDHLELLQRTIGYQYCRFHGIFHDDMAVVIRRPDGGIHYQWHQVDKVYDSLMRLGLRPFVELNPMPVALASGEQTMFWWKMNVTPPRHMPEWEDLVRAFTLHLIDRYGLDEVRTWYFEVWNEPNLGGFWSGTQADYWDLYDASARAVKNVDAQLRIGGPATSKANWLTEFINHCVDTNVPVDFVSTHLYPQDEQVVYPDRQGSPHTAGAFFADTVRAARLEVQSSRLPELPIQWTEWNAMSAGSAADVDWIENPTNDSLFGASFIVRNMIELDSAAESMCWWIASDIFEESGLPHSAFSCTYGMLTIGGIPKASYHAFHFLSKMKGDVLTLIGGNLPEGCGLLAATEGSITRIILWHSVPMGETPGPTWHEDISIPIQGPGVYDLVTARITAGAGSCWESWCAMGKPQNLTTLQDALLKAHAMPQYELKTLSAGPSASTIPLSVQLPPLDVLYLEVSPRGMKAAPKGANSSAAATKRWNLAMSDLSN